MSTPASAKLTTAKIGNTCIRRIAKKVEDNCRQAAYLAERVEAHPELELATPVSLNIVCFRFIGQSPPAADLNHLNTEIVMDLQEREMRVTMAATTSGSWPRKLISPAKSKRDTFI